MRCTIEGEILNRESEVLLLRKSSVSFRSFSNNPETIWIENGKFSYTFPFNEFEAYELIFEDELEKGSWRPILFFPVDGKIEFQLNTEGEWKKNIIKGGELNEEYKALAEQNEKIFGQRRNELMQIQNDLDKEDELNSDAYKEVLKKLRETKDGDHDSKVPLFQKMEELEKTHARYTNHAKQSFINPYDSLIKAELKWKYDYIKKNPSIVSYYLIWSDVEMQMKQHPLIAQLVPEVFPFYEKKYPNHAYTKMIATQVKGLNTINVGNKYIDFSAPNVEGDTLQLSKIIQSHVSLIDMWGSWCGPCIAKTRLIMPVYEKYKNKGFKLVGVAREFNNTDAVRERIKKEKYSWPNLIDLDDRLNIWNLYGISNGVGLMVLVDKDGTILAIDPTAKELEAILQQKLE